VVSSKHSAYVRNRNLSEISCHFNFPLSFCCCFNFIYFAFEAWYSREDISKCSSSQQTQPLNKSTMQFYLFMYNLKVFLSNFLTFFACPPEKGNPKAIWNDNFLPIFCSILCVNIMIVSWISKNPKNNNLLHLKKYSNFIFSNVGIEFFNLNFSTHKNIINLLISNC
jgi:hypothetical protein